MRAKVKDRADIANKELFYVVVVVVVASQPRQSCRGVSTKFRCKTTFQINSTKYT